MTKYPITKEIGGKRTRATMRIVIQASEFVIPSSLGISSFGTFQFGVRRLVMVAELVRVCGRSRKSPKSHDFGYT